MKIALLHNPTAGDAALRPSQLTSPFKDAGYEVLYVCIKEKGWQKVFSEPFDRMVIAGGDGTVGRLAPWLAGGATPFCILPLGTANNCARSLSQMNTLQSVVSGLKSAQIKKLDLGIVTSSDGYQLFLESIGIGLLAGFMREMRTLQHEKKSRNRLGSEERLMDALKYLRWMAEDYPEIECELLLDNEAVAGRFLLLEIANMAFIGPNLQLFPRPDPSDGWLNVVWIESEQRNQWRQYLQLCGRGKEAIAPANSRRCQRIYIHYTNDSAHIDSKVFSSLVTPVSIRLERSALHLIDLGPHRFLGSPRDAGTPSASILR